MRPRTLDEFVGQEHILGPGKSLRVQIERDDTGSLIFWGPPGVGKTTLAKIIARMTHADFIEFSAVLSGHQGNQAGDGRRRARAAVRHPHHRLRRRSTPLQQGAAGRLSALRREGQHSPDRRDHRESVVRNHLGAAVALPRVRAEAADARSRSSGCCSARWPTTSAAWASCTWKRTTMRCARLRPTPAATRAAPTTRWKSRRRWRASSRREQRSRASPTPSSPTRCKSAC